MTANVPLFSFSQIEVPWPLGPADGRYLLRDRAGEPEHVVVLSTLGAQRRRGPLTRRSRTAAAEPGPAEVTTGRATVIATAALRDEAAGRAWLRRSGDPELAADLAVLERVLDAQRTATFDPYLPLVGRAHLLVARIGFGDGEQVAYGKWSQARELLPSRPRARHALDPSTRVAAILSGRGEILTCERLALRAHADIEAGRWRTAPLQLQAALTAAIAELGDNPRGAGREELTGHLTAVTAIAERALHEAPTESEHESLAAVLRRLDTALRAHAAY